MVELSRNEIGPDIEAMFSSAEPAQMRLFGVLDGILPGRVIADRTEDPNWVVVQERVYGSIYLGGEIAPFSLKELIDALRQDGDVLLGMWLRDPRWVWVTREPEYEGQVLDFYDRPTNSGLDLYLDSIPDGCEMRFIDQELFKRSANCEQHIASFGSLERALENLFGFFLMSGDEILCKTLAGPVIRGTREPGVDTYEPHRRKGYATITCAYLIDACEKAGLTTWWNCSGKNLASAALARRLGYRVEKAYRLVAWFRKT